MNAMIRRIDLSVNILAPIIVGLIMNFASMTVAALFITGWNICSMIVEYFLLLKVYKAVPALSRKTRGGGKAQFYLLCLCSGGMQRGNYQVFYLIWCSIIYWAFWHFFWIEIT